MDQGAGLMPVAQVLQRQAGGAHDFLVEIDELGLPDSHACSLPSPVIVGMTSSRRQGRGARCTGAGIARSYLLAKAATTANHDRAASSGRAAVSGCASARRSPRL